MILYFATVIILLLFVLSITRTNNYQSFRYILQPFGMQFVKLKHFDNSWTTHRAYRLNNTWYAAPYLPNTAMILEPRGVMFQISYIDEWKPITKKIRQFYYS